MIDNIRVYEDTYRDLRSKGHTKLSFPQYMERMLERNIKLRRQEFEERKIVLKPQPQY